MTASRDGTIPKRRAADQAQAEAIFTSVGDGFISTDEFGHITRINPVALKLLGYKRQELLNAWFPEKIIAVYADNMPVSLIDRPITKALLTGKPISEKTFLRRKNGEIIPVAVTASPILMNGKPIGATQIFRDITLEQEVDRMKSEFISLASHQLRTPLSAIKTYSHMLSDGLMGPLHKDQLKALETIISASNRMNELISTLLNITRIETGTIAVTFKTVNVCELVSELMPELTLMAHNKSITLKIKQPPKIERSRLRIISDSLIIKEVVTNLASNAIKYTPDNGKVEIIIRPGTKDVRVSVKDSGWGIPLHSQDQVFSKFFRAHNIVKKETTGTGLGLYLVKGLLDAVGGTIWFNSKEGKGTNFTFTLPRKPSKNLIQI